MPVVNNMGQSDCTPVKHEHYQTVMQAHMKICRNMIQGRNYAARQYLHFDINPGDGGTPGDYGSPVITSTIAARLDLPFRGVFIEIDETNAKRLSERFADAWNITVHHGNHADILPQYITNPPLQDKNGRSDWIFGSLFSDPNGSAPPWELLTEFAAVYQRIDIIIYLSAANIKRVRRAAEERGEHLPCLIEQMTAVPKKHWLVREKQAKHEWTFLIGTNWTDFPEFKRQGFYMAGSEHGRDILHELTYTKEERQQDRQLALPFEQPPYRTYTEYLNHPAFRAIRAQAFMRAGGVCEMCGKRPPTDIHHVKYPPWGTFEKDASNLLAICHECHCEVHGKAS